MPVSVSWALGRRSLGGPRQDGLSREPGYPGCPLCAKESNAYYK